MTTSELSVENASLSNDLTQQEFVGVARPRYEILAGCVKVDDDHKASVGCTTEFAHNSSQPISRHCICESHLCNFYDLLYNDNLAERNAIDGQSHDNGNGVIAEEHDTLNDSVSFRSFSHVLVYLFVLSFLL